MTSVALSAARPSPSLNSIATLRRARVALWLKANPLRHKLWQSEYRAKNDHKYIGTRKAWAAKNIERRRGFTRKYRASVAATTALADHEWTARIDEFNSCCAYCRNPLTPDEITQDHFRPVSRGGIHDLDNVVPACGSCNYRKNSGLVFDWLPRGVGTAISPKRSR